MTMTTRATTDRAATDHAMTEVTVLFLDGTFSSTATGPMEVFRHAGTLWNVLTGTRPVPRFRVTTASADGRAVRCDGPIYIQPDTAINSIRKTDLIFIPTTGLSIDDVVERNAPVVPWLRRWQKRGAAVASVCSGVGLVAATGLLDGKRATTHWGLAERFREKYPRVKWMPELMVTEDHGFYCGGGVHAALDLSLYLVEQFCGHEIALQSAKAMLIETPRAWQAGFAIVPLNRLLCREPGRAACTCRTRRLAAGRQCPDRCVRRARRASPDLPARPRWDHD